jgi:hypothetical protein
LSTTKLSDGNGDSDEPLLIDVVDEVVLPGDFNGNGVSDAVDEVEAFQTTLEYAPSVRITDVHSEQTFSESLLNVAVTETPAAFKGAIAVDRKTGKRNQSVEQRATVEM